MNTDEKIIELAQANPAIKLLAQLDKGRVAATLAEKLPLVIEAVKRTGKKGKLTLDIVLEPEGKGEVVTVEISGVISVKLPERETRATIFFITEDNGLSSRDPNQTEIDFTAPPKAAPAITAAMLKNASR